MVHPLRSLDRECRYERRSRAVKGSPIEAPPSEPACRTGLQHLQQQVLVQTGRTQTAAVTLRRLRSCLKGVERDAKVTNLGTAIVLSLRLPIQYSLARTEQRIR